MHFRYLTIFEAYWDTWGFSYIIKYSCPKKMEATKLKPSLLTTDHELLSLASH